MEFTTDKAQLLQALFFTQGIADRRATMPILANVLLRTDANSTLSIAATDLNLTVVTHMQCDVASPGGLTISAKHLYDMVKSLPNDKVTIKKESNDYAGISAGKVRYKIVGLSDKDFPNLPSPKDVKFFSMDKAVFNDLIRKTFFSISADETRYHLNGALFQIDAGIARMVSTDGHRLSKCDRALSSDVQVKPGILIPRRGLIEIRKALDSATVDTVEMGLFQNHLFLKTGETILSIKLNDAQFPPYEQVIPKEHEKKVIVSRSMLIDSVKRISLMAPDKTCGVKFSVSKGALKIEADNPELGQAKEEMGAQYSGKEISIGFNARYLLELLAEMDSSEVCMSLNGELDPGVVQPVDESKKAGNDYVGVVMPMKL